MVDKSKETLSAQMQAFADCSPEGLSVGPVMRGKMCESAKHAGLTPITFLIQLPLAFKQKPTHPHIVDALLQCWKSQLIHIQSRDITTPFNFT